MLQQPSLSQVLPREENKKRISVIEKLCGENRREGHLSRVEDSLMPLYGLSVASTAKYLLPTEADLGEYPKVGMKVQMCKKFA